MTHFPPVNRWILACGTLELSLSEMRPDGLRGDEGVALWLGRRESQQSVVTHVVGLRGRGISKAPDLLMISAAMLNEVTDIAIERGLCLVGQIHSHGPMFGTDLSPTDLRYGINVPYYLSLVAPDFALRPRTKIADCGIHVYEPRRGYRRLMENEVQARIVEDGNQTAEMLIVNES